MELDTADHRRSSGVTSGLHRMLTIEIEVAGARLTMIGSVAPELAQR